MLEQLYRRQLLRHARGLGGHDVEQVRVEGRSVGVGQCRDESVKVAGGAVGERRFRCAEEDAEKWLHLADLLQEQHKVLRVLRPVLTRWVEGWHVPVLPPCFFVDRRHGRSSRLIGAT